MASGRQRGGERSTRLALRPESRPAVGENRDEILRLIDKLRENRDGGRAGVIERTLREQADRIGKDGAPAAGWRQRPSSGRPAPALSPSLARRTGHTGRYSESAGARPSRHILQSIEERLARIESQLASGGGAQPAATTSSGQLDGTLQGVIQGDLLSDILQLVSSNSLTGVFQVKHEDTQYELFFREGQIEHAEGSGVSGEGAFFAAFGLGTGRYVFRETDELPDKKTIDGNTQFLILEALRQIDESSGD